MSKQWQLEKWELFSHVTEISISDEMVHRLYRMYQNIPVDSILGFGFMILDLGKYRYIL